MIPLIVSGRTTASADLALAVLSTKEKWELWDVVQAIMRTVDPAMTALVEVQGNRVHATTDETTALAWLNLVEASKSTWLRCNPSDSHFISTWLLSDSVNWQDMSEFFHPFNRRTMQQIVRKFSMPYGSSRWCAYIFVDQAAGNVTAFWTNDDAQFLADFEAVTLAGDSFCYRLATPNKQSLNFE